MNAFGLAWRCWIRQPARAWLGVCGIAAVGALLFDMLLLSQGLVISFADALESMAFDVRVTATDSLPGTGPELEDGALLSEQFLTLDDIESAVALRFSFVELHVGKAAPWREANLLGAGIGARRPWQLLIGHDLPDRSAEQIAVALINQYTSSTLDLGVGDVVELRGLCENSGRAVPLQTFTISGIALFPFDSAGSLSLTVGLDRFQTLCGDSHYGGVDMILVASQETVDSDQAAASLRSYREDLHVFTNRQFLSTFETNDFSYFRQISSVLTSVTLVFTFLLITSILTVSTNQRLGEIAALRAMGFSRGRIIADLCWESALFVGTGGLLALPLGWITSLWLDDILKRMPGFPASLHFFVMHAGAIWTYLGLLAIAGALASLYPIWLASRLPIADTLRREVL